MPSPLVLLSDLDDTLFDHAHATREALGRLRSHEPALAEWPQAELEHRHHEILERLHREVVEGRRTIDDARIARFTRLLEDAGADDVPVRADAAAQFYRRAYQSVWRAVPGAVALLQTLRDAGIRVAIVTNNGTAEQRGKLHGCGLAPLIDLLVTSEDVGVPKPDARMFDVALDGLGVTASEAVMFGDAWATDIEGARAAGIRAVWLNRLGAVAPDASVTQVASLEPAEDVVRTLIG